MGMPLIDMQGNNGSIDGDPAAAYRYTESRLQTIANFLLSDLDKDTVEFSPNYDDKDIEPTVLPAFFPNILINGSTGIAAGYATNMPPHNLTEVINATIAMIENPEIKLEQLMKYLKAPDFPTGGVLQQLNGVKEAFKTGKGKIIINAKWHQEQHNLIIDEIPYEVVKQDLVKKIGDVADNNPGLGIKEILDETDKSGLRISISLNPKANFETVRKFLFKATPLSIAYNYNNVVIINKQPKQVGLIEILKAYLDHYVSVYRRKTTFDLEKAKNRLEIIDGLIKAMSILDEIIALIRKSENRKDAIDKLKKKFSFSTVQSEAIVDMRLYRLSSTDMELLKKEQSELTKQVAHFKTLLKKPEVLNQEIITNLQAIKSSFPMKRRSQLSQADESFEVNAKDTVMEKKYHLFISQDGYLKAIDANVVSKNDLETFGRKPGDLFLTTFEVSNMDHLLLISSTGVYYSIPLFKVVTSR
jgi:topoisomerase-4 subunit A